MTAEDATSPRIVVFDFDGVVCDSTDECLVSSWNAWESWNGGQRFRVDLADFDDVESRGFRQIRPRVRGAGEYYVVRRCLEEGVDIGNQPRYDELLERWRDHIEPFKKCFYAARQRLRDYNLKKWLALHPVY